MITKKMQIEALKDQVGELQRRLRKVEDKYDTLEYSLRNQMATFLKSYIKEEVGYVIVKRDRDEIVAQIKNNIAKTILKDIK